MRKAVLTIILVAVVAALVVLSWVYFYPGRYEPPAVSKPLFEDITAPAPLVLPFAEKTEKQVGTLVLDSVHDNQFAARELNVLLSRVLSRGFTLEYLGESSPDRQEMLRYADALVIILPQEAFSPPEVKLIREFVRKGGKLLLIGDPTRPSEINSVAAEFGLMFENDYLYNLNEYDGNYRNVFITEFAQANMITRNLAKIALYSAGSISSPDKGIAFSDENTLSSVRIAEGKLSPLALTEGAKVLAISDLTFMAEPYNAAWDNNQLISNVADWLTESERVFTLSDFPYFLEDKAYVTYADPYVIDIGIELENFLIERGKKPALSQYEDGLDGDMVFMGFFKEAEKVEKYLEKGKITVNVTTEVKKEPTTEGTTANPPSETEKEITKVEIGNIGQVYREEGTSIIYLDQSDKRDVLIILSDTPKMMKDTVKLLKSGEFRNWSVSDNLSIYYAAKPAVGGS